MIPDIVETIAYKVTILFKNAYPESVKDEEKLYIWLSFKISEIMIISLTMIIGIFTEAFVNSILSLTSFWTLRKITGGFHMKSLTACVLVSTTLLSVTPHVQFSDKIGWALTIFSIILIILFSENKIKYRYNHLNVIFAIIMVLISAFIHLDVLIVTFFSQSVLLIPKGGESTC